MGLNGCHTAMKWSLIVFNVLILCAGAIAIGLGSWGLASEYGAERLRDLTGEFYRGTAIAIIVGGCIMVLISFVGFLGAFLENRILLGIYFVIMLLLLILFVVAAAVAFAYRDTLENEITQQMKDTLKYNYGVFLNDSRNSDITDVWDDIQKKLKCCGVKGRIPNSEESWFLWQDSAWFHAQLGEKEYVPESCCNINNPNYQNECQKLNADPTKPIQKNVTAIMSESEQIYNKGCFDQLKDEIREHILAIAGISVAIIIVMVLCILFSICVCANINRRKMVV